jgi:hypothetical protein
VGLICLAVEVSNGRFGYPYQQHKVEIFS